MATECWIQLYNSINWLRRLRSGLMRNTEPRQRERAHGPPGACAAGSRSGPGRIGFLDRLVPVADRVGKRTTVHSVCWFRGPGREDREKSASVSLRCKGNRRGLNVPHCCDTTIAYRLTTRLPNSQSPSVSVLPLSGRWPLTYYTASESKRARRLQATDCPQAPGASQFGTASGRLRGPPSRSLGSDTSRSQMPNVNWWKINPSESEWQKGTPGDITRSITRAPKDLG